MIAILVAVAVAGNPVEAERQFAADAYNTGQWTAFRKWSAEDAVMFVPQPVNAHEFLRDKEDPKVAVFWWPGRSFVACDGSLAINTGPWVREWGKSVGYFTTVWRREGDSWRWIYDGGDSLKKMRGEGGEVQPQLASCEGDPEHASASGPSPAVGQLFGGGTSSDGTLVWSWAVNPKGGRHFLAKLWNGRSFDVVIEDWVVPAE